MLYRFRKLILFGQWKTWWDTEGKRILNASQINRSMNI
jgi:hypothetical protein